MSLITFPSILEQGLSNLIHQWQNKPIVVGLLTSYLENMQSFIDTCEQLLDERSLTTAIGAQLDVLGLLLGEVRGSLSDTEYRALLTTRIQLNASTGTEGTINEALKTITGSTKVTLQDVYPTTLVARIDGTLPDRDLSGLIAATISPFFMITGEGHTPFVFSDNGVDDPGGLGFASLTPSTVNAGSIINYDASMWVEGRLVFDGVDQYALIGAPFVATDPVYAIGCTVTPTLPIVADITPIALTSTSSDVPFVMMRIDSASGKWFCYHTDDAGVAHLAFDTGQLAREGDTLLIEIPADGKPNFYVNGTILAGSPTDMSGTTVALKGVGGRIRTGDVVEHFKGEITNCQTSTGLVPAEDRYYPLTEGSGSTLYNTNAAANSIVVGGGTLVTMKQYA